MSDEPKAPQPPEELWMLWDVVEDDWVRKEEGTNDPGGGLIVCKSLVNAVHQACYQHEVFNVVSTPIRVK